MDADRAKLKSFDPDVAHAIAGEERRQLDGVESTNSLALLNRRVLAGLNEGNPKWYEFLPNQDMLNTVTAGAPRGLYAAGGFVPSMIL